MLEFFNSKIRPFIDNNLFAIVYGLLFLMALGVVITVVNVITVPDQAPTNVVNTGKKADYSSDMNFLQCLSIQHECIYDNIESGNEKFILSNCKGKDFCSEGIVVRGKK